MPVVKVSSWGNKGRAQERAHLKYIARFGTLQDECGQPIDIDEALNSGRYNFNRRTTSARLIISLPKEGTELAMQIVLDEMRERYPHFVAAYHDTNDNGERQPHLHIDIQSHRGWQWRQSKKEWRSLKGSLDQQFAAAGLGFKKTPGRIYRRRTQAEIHMSQRFARTGTDQKLWKDNMARAVQMSIKEVSRAANGDIFALVACLLKAGIIVSRLAEKSITLKDAQGNRCRLGRLYPQLRTRGDVEKLLSDMRQKAQALAQSEQQRPAHTAPAKPTTPTLQQNDNLQKLIQQQQAAVARMQTQHQPGFAGPSI